MRAFSLFLLLSLASAAGAQTYYPIQGYCNQGGTSALVQGLKATNYHQGIIPGCLVTVYLTGTTNKATLYSNSTGTSLGNPFTANVLGTAKPGFWVFYVANGQQYDVVGSGGIAPNAYAAPVTLAVAVSPYGGAICISGFTCDANFASVATACTAAATAHQTLFLTEAWANLPTQSINCNIARSGSGSLQAAAGATLTFTGQYSGPFTPWIDIHTNAGASLVWQSDSTLYPDYLGAVGNGTSDDTVYVQEFLTTLLNSNSYESYNNPAGWGVLGENYLVTQPLNATCVDGYKRLSLWNLAITHKVTTGSPGAALDIGGCNGGFYYGLSVGAYGDNPANSPMVTSAILLTNGKWTSGYNDEAGGGSFFDHISACGGYNNSTSTGAGTASFVSIGADLVTIQNSTLGCNGGVGYGGGHGSGLVWGYTLGHATAVTSAFYTFNPSPGGPTNLMSYNNTIYGDYGAPVQFTGSASYTMNGGYVALIGTGLGGSELDWPTGDSAGNDLFCQGLNTEDQSSATVPVFNFEQGPGGMDCTGRFDTGGALIALPNSYSQLSRANIKNVAGSEGSIFSLNPTGVQLYNDNIQAGVSTSSLGTVSGAIFAGVTLQARQIPCATMTANNGNPAGISGTGNQYYGINGCHQYSDLTVGAGGAFTVSGSGAVSAPSASITALTAGTVTATGNIAGQAGLNLPSLLTGPFQNYAPYSVNIQSGATWAVQSGFTDFTYAPSGTLDTFGNPGTNITCPGGNCRKNDTESGGTPLPALTPIVLCVKGQSTSGSQALGVQIEAVGGATLTFTTAITTQCATITTLSSTSATIIGLYQGSSAPALTIFGVGAWVQGQSAGIYNTEAAQQISQVLTTISAPLIAGSLTVPSGRTGTLHCTSGGAITASNANYLATSSVNFTTNTPGGTQTYAPNITASTPGTSFTATCAVGDTTLYNYTIWN